MPYQSRVILVFGLAVSAMAASPPARAQITPDVSADLGRPSWDRLSPNVRPRSAIPWTDAPASRPGLSMGGITQLQAMNHFAAAGFTDIIPPDPTPDGGWSSYASWQGSKVRVRLDPEGRISVNY